MILDVGPETAQAFAEILKTSKTFKLLNSEYYILQDIKIIFLSLYYFNN